MTRLVILFSLLFLAVNTPLSACSCDPPPPTFCQFITPFLTQGKGHIITGRPVRFYERDTFGLTETYVDVVVTGTLYGTDTLATDTITFKGGNGLNCGYNLNTIDASAEQLFFYVNQSDASTDPFFRYPLNFLYTCGPSVLPIEDGEIVGPIALGVDRVPVEEFSTREDLCLAAPLPEDCSCTLVEVDFCDEAAAIDQAGEDLGILRIEPLPGFDLVYDLNGFRVLVTNAVVREELVWSDFSVGDTLSVVIRTYDGCVKPLFGAEVLMLYTSFDETGGENDPGFGYRVADHPLLRAPECAQRAARVENDSVRTNAGWVEYGEYLEQLAVCVPALDVINRSVQIGLRAFPNPVTDRLTVTWSGAGVRRAELVDMHGRVLRNRVLESGEQSAVFRVAELSAGLYFVRLETLDGTATRKVLVNH